MPSYVFERAKFKRPVFSLEHAELYISFFEDRVDVSSKLRMTATEDAASVSLDALNLEMHEVRLTLDGKSDSAQYNYDGKTLKIDFPRIVKAGETVETQARTTCHPSETRLSGIYRDTTPPGAPQQYMSQCQQFGFREIAPVIDDCTAKCTFRTTLEGSSAYTHLVSNGDVDLSENPSGQPVALEGNPGRKRITYVNSRRMAPYLFIAAAGTWDVLEDEVSCPGRDRKIKLEYLVPPGRTDGAKLPMEILKDSVVWQNACTGYVYPYSTYRTITMEKSLYGGMENTGNTTIITEAALIDENISDDRLVYAHGVIPHEYEHNHCGSGVTMESVFDMWLNEAYTVNIERAYLKTRFDPVFIRLKEIDAMRSPVGPLAEEETGKFGRIVREGVNDPDEVVDNVTYVKAPEVLNVLRFLIGEDAYRKGAELYFKRYDDSNANTDQFLQCFSEVSGRDIPKLMHEWLFSIGYPAVSASHSYDETSKTLTLHLSQTRTGTGGLFNIPVPFSAVDGSGRDIPGASGMFVLSSSKDSLSISGVEKPAYISWNRGVAFYGTLADESASPESLVLQAETDSDIINRVFAVRALSDRERRVMLASMAAGRPVSPPSAQWCALLRRIFRDGALSFAQKGALLRIDENPSDRSLCSSVRENWRIRRMLLAGAARTIGVETLASALRGRMPSAISEAVLRRTFNACVVAMLGALDTPDAHDVLERHLMEASNITERVNTLLSIWTSSHPRRREILDAAGFEMRKSLNGYISYLQIAAASPRIDVFDIVGEEEKRDGWSISHPGLSRALYCAMTRNNAQIWTSRGLAWFEEKAAQYASVSEYNTLRMMAPFERFASFEPELRLQVRGVLERLRSKLPADRFPALNGRLSVLLG